MTPVGFRIYYADGTVLSSRDTAWETAPQNGVQVVTEYYAETYRIWQEDHWDVENYCRIWSGCDYYWRVSDSILAGNAPDLPTGLPDGAVKVGATVSDAEFAAAIARAQSERVF